MPSGITMSVSRRSILPFFVFIPNAESFDTGGGFEHAVALFRSTRASPIRAGWVHPRRAGWFQPSSTAAGGGGPGQKAGVVAGFGRVTVGGGQEEMLKVVPMFNFALHLRSQPRCWETMPYAAPWPVPSPCPCRLPWWKRREFSKMRFRVLACSCRSRCRPRSGKSSCQCALPDAPAHNGRQFPAARW